jgi:NAD(P)-dependent dehydrogenase (short-subunit alcohol dehydrogenase family)
VPRHAQPTAARPRSAVVTGGARGIGKATASLLVRRGYSVVLTDLDGEQAAATAAEIGAVAGLQQDVADEAGHDVVARHARAHAPLAAWFGNAGVGHEGAAADQPSESVRELVAVNVLGTLWGARAAVRALREQASAGESRGGDIILTSSLSAHGPVPGMSVYAATKAAVLSLASSMHTELRKEHIRMHAICPDGADTELVSQLESRGQGSALIHSGGGLLSVDQVAEAMVGLIGSRRVYRTLPAYRGVLMRLAQVAPGPTMRLEPLIRRQGQLIEAATTHQPR